MPVVKQPPLLPVSVERSDGADASGDELVAVAVDDAYDGAYVAQVEDEDGLKRKRALLGLVLCLLCTAVVMLLAEAARPPPLQARHQVVLLVL